LQRQTRVNEAQEILFATIKNICNRALARDQKDPVKMIVEAIELERDRCVALLQTSGGGNAQIPACLIDPDLD
uniref:hypothetical protein n=1 Tax=Shinella sp. TaxID=1870904 RepID=UPI003F70A2B8